MTIKDKLEQLRADLEIDAASIDRAIAKQPQLYLTAAELLSHATSIADEMKDKLKLVEAKLYLTIREKLISNDEKFTETVLTSRVAKAEKVVSARSDLRRAQQDMNDAQALKEAYSQRSYMLNHMADLIVSGYLNSNSHSSSKSEASYSAARARLEGARSKRDRV